MQLPAGNNYRNRGSAHLKVSGLRRYFISNQRKGFFGPRKFIKAVDDISFTIARGHALGLVGESGCGKSSTAKVILNIIPPQAGRIKLGDTELTGLKPKDWKSVRKRMQYVFQDPLAALDPRKKILSQVIEPLIIYGQYSTQKRRKKAVKALRSVGLREYLAYKYPHELSGGQQQRVVIARALMLEPELLICDEPISSLDVSIQAQVVNLLDELRRRLDLTLLFISHDLSVVRHLCDRVAVMYIGRIVEIANVDDLYENPKHPYTQALLSAIPIPDPDLMRNKPIILGEPPSILDPPPGCTFHPRCPMAEKICTRQQPRFVSINGTRKIACHVAAREHGL
jgi:peptide/nickel transport system ATP-binding protein/oligopeptide transport system ATP-binding protein